MTRHSARLCRAFLWTAAAAAVLPAQAGDAAAWQWQLSAGSDRHSDALPIAAYTDDDDAWQHVKPRKGGNIAYARDELRLSARQGVTTWSLLARQSVQLVATRASYEFLEAVGGGATPAGDRVWPVQVRYTGFVGAGGAVDRRFELAGWTLDAGLQLLSVRRLTEWRVSGLASFDAASGLYGFNAQSQEARDRMSVPYGGRRNASGGGALGELGAQRCEAAWCLALRWQDAGWLRWNKLPVEEQSVSSQTSSRDANGVLVYQPLIRGRTLVTSYTSRLAGRGDADATWQVAPAWRIGVGSEFIPRFGLLPRSALQVGPNDWHGGVEWRWHERRATVSMGGRWWAVSLGADRGVDHSKAFGLQLRWPW